MNEAAIEAQKADLRVRARALRAKLGASERAEASKAVAEHFFHGLSPQTGAVVAAYWPIRDEVDCQPILIRLMDSQQPVCLPAVSGEGQPLQLRLWEQGAPLYPSGFGTLAPSDLAPLVEPDMVLVPLLAFDSAGTRLGYGGGYYDRTLAAMPKRPVLVGLAFAVQQLDSIPRVASDVPLDAVVTEAGIMHFAGGLA